jgi:putative radical SAM enzyme (TIGR03279 family)
MGDVLDYQYFTYDARLHLRLRTCEGDEREIRVRKGDGEELGLEFEDYLGDRARRCANNCIFCFIDQMPPGMRETLYFKDDDVRLSFLQGNYISLTNLSERDLARIEALRISPINVSVQTTDPELRVKMLGNPRAGKCLELMRRLADARITMNCQIVVCPGYNDGPQLARSIEDLGALYPPWPASPWCPWD